MLAVRRPGYGARRVERDDPAHANMREMWGCGGQWARPTDRDREATKAVGIIAHQANRREQVMAKELTNEELALWCEDMGKVFVEVAAKHPGDVRALPVRNAFTIIAERLRNPPDSSRVRDATKEFPNDLKKVLAFYRGDWVDAHFSNEANVVGWFKNNIEYGDDENRQIKPTHWLPMPPAPKEASDVG